MTIVEVKFFWRRGYPYLLLANLHGDAEILPFDEAKKLIKDTFNVEVYEKKPIVVKVRNPKLGKVPWIELKLNFNPFSPVKVSGILDTIFLKSEEDEMLIYVRPFDMKRFYYKVRDDFMNCGITGFSYETLPDLISYEEIFADIIRAFFGGLTGHPDLFYIRSGYSSTFNNFITYVYIGRGKEKTKYIAEGYLHADASLLTELLSHPQMEYYSVNFYKMLEKIDESTTIERNITQGEFSLEFCSNNLTFHFRLEKVHKTREFKRDDKTHVETKYESIAIIKNIGKYWYYTPPYISRVK